MREATEAPQSTFDARPQVAPEHYELSRYETSARWTSYWHQVREITRWKPESVLEVGVGSRFVTHHLRGHGVNVETLDVDARLNPDHVASVTAIPLPDDAVDVASCCQVLEHLPFEEFPVALRELARVTRRAVVMSLPDAGRAVNVSVRGTVWPQWSWWVRLPLPARVHEWDGQHHWEVNRRGYPLRRVLHEITDSGFHVEKTFLAPENPYHRFFVMTP